MMNKAEKILIIDRFDVSVDETVKLLDLIQSQVGKGEKISYSSANLADANNKFRETIKKL
jgi:hypothetical protein